MGEVILRPREQCLERGKETAGNSAGAAGMVAAADSEGDRGASRDDLRLPESCGRRHAGAARPDIPAKPASREEGVITDPAEAKPASLDEVITDSGGESATLAEAKPDPQPGRSPSSSACTTVPGRDRTRALAWPKRHGDLAGVGGHLRLRRRLPERQAVCLQAAGKPVLRKPCAVIETAPGEEAQVDYGDGPMVRDPQSGKYRRTRLFVLTLGYSRKSVRLLVFRSSSQTWAELHEKAFRRLGGVTRVVVLDNLREGVLTPTYTTPHSILCTATCSGIMARCRCHAGSGIRIGKEKWKAVSGTRRRHR